MGFAVISLPRRPQKWIFTYKVGFAASKSLPVPLHPSNKFPFYPTKSQVSRKPHNHLSYLKLTLQSSPGAGLLL